MTKDEALKLALEVLKRIDEVTPTAMAKLVMPEIEQALNQPEQEPVAWMTINAYGEEDDIHYENPEGHLPEGWTYKPLYTHPPNVQSENEPLEYWNAVEGWVKLDEVREHFDSVSCGTIYKNGGEGRVPLYTQQRTWVDLTKEECFELCVKHKDNSFSLLVAVQEKLMEKNNG